MVVKKLEQIREIGKKEATHFHVQSYNPEQHILIGSYGAYEKGEDGEQFVAYSNNSFVTEKTKDFPDLTQEEIDELNGAVSE